MKQHPLYLKHPKNKIIFIVHIVNTSGQWDLRDIASEDLSPCIQRAPLGSINSVACTSGKTSMSYTRTPRALYAVKTRCTPFVIPFWANVSCRCAI